MAVIHGQIESLKRIRETLNQKGIYRFNSIGDINWFLNNYDHEKEEIFFKIEREFDLELYNLQAAGFQLQKTHDDNKNKAETKLNNRINQLKTKCTALSKPAKNAVMELLNWYRQQILLAIKFNLERNFNFIIWLQTLKPEKNCGPPVKGSMGMRPTSRKPSRPVVPQSSRNLKI